MKTFDEIKESFKKQQEDLMAEASTEVLRGGLEAPVERMLRSVAQDCENNIANIDEYTAIQIGAMTNYLILVIQRAYPLYAKGHHKNFEKFFEEHISGITKDGKLKEGKYLGQSQCASLGINTEDVSCFKDIYPTMSNKACDLFRQLVNANFGTNIPMSGIVERASEDYESVRSNENVDRTTKDQAYMHLREAQRDSGYIRTILATDREYQEAKARCTGMKF